MKGSRVAKRYARALLELGSEPAQLEAWGEELRRLAQALASPELSALLASPQAPQTARVAAAEKVAASLGLGFPARSFAVVVARHGRTGEIEAMAEAYGALLDERLNRARATLSFAREPSDEDVARAVSWLETLAGKKIIATVKVNAELLGGVTAELQGKIYDGSLEARLLEAERRLVG